MILHIDGNINRYYVQTLCMVFFPGSTFGENETPRDDVPEVTVSVYPDGKDSETAYVSIKLIDRVSEATETVYYSEEISIFTDSVNLKLEVENGGTFGYKTVTWPEIQGVDNYTLTVIENRRSRYEGDIPSNTPVVYNTGSDTSVQVYFNPNRKYSLELKAGDYTANINVVTEKVYNPDANAIEEAYPTTSEEAKALQTTITVPVWMLRNGKKVSSTVTITVHRGIAQKMELVFEEIYNGKEQFPIKDVGAYAWRGGRSEHNGGTAIDINYNENYCIYNNGTTIGAYWKPGEDLYSILPYGDVMNAFEKHGFTWGGDSWSNPKDYMHFSYLGT